MSKIAYTIGRTTSYEKAIREPGGTKKLGRRPNDDPPYDGGWVWPTIEQANAFRTGLMEINLPSWKAKDFSVYELDLPNGWDVDVSQELVAPETAANGARFLLNDAQIIGAVANCEICGAATSIDTQQPICEDCYGTEAYCDWESK